MSDLYDRFLRYSAFRIAQRRADPSFDPLDAEVALLLEVRTVLRSPLPTPCWSIEPPTTPTPEDAVDLWRCAPHAPKHVVEDHGDLFADWRIRTAPDFRPVGGQWCRVLITKPGRTP